MKRTLYTDMNKMRLNKKEAPGNPINSCRGKSGVYMWYWYLFLCVIVFNTVAICMKKKLKPIDMYATIVTSMLIQTKVDRWTDKLDWYGFFSRWFIDAPTLLVNVGLYPAAAVIMLN